MHKLLFWKTTHQKLTTKTKVKTWSERRNVINNEFGTETGRLTWNYWILLQLWLLTANDIYTFIATFVLWIDTSREIAVEPINILINLLLLCKTLLINLLLLCTTLASTLTLECYCVVWNNKIFEAKTLLTATNNLHYFYIK